MDKPQAFVTVKITRIELIVIALVAFVAGVVVGVLGHLFLNGEDRFGFKEFEPGIEYVIDPDSVAARFDPASGEPVYWAYGGEMPKVRGNDGSVLQLVVTTPARYDLYKIPQQRAPGFKSFTGVQRYGPWVLNEDGVLECPRCLKGQ